MGRQDTTEATPDLTGATPYILTGDNPRGTGTWWIRPDDTVIYERAEGHYTPPNSKWETTTVILTADTLRTSPTWTARTT